MKSKLIPDGTGRDQIRRPPPKSLAELKIRAEALAGRSVRELATGLGFVVPEDNVRSKGFVGQLVEYALGADPSAGELPDFTGLEVELKTIDCHCDRCRLCHHCKQPRCKHRNLMVAGSNTSIHVGALSIHSTVLCH